MTEATGSYTVLARRYRPQTFDEVVGQQHVAQALRNAILCDRVAHAYLFTGARGVGKTSMARILAKALNCPEAVDGNPCNKCDLCLAIAEGGDVDVMEIDGASNRGIDDIRALRANVGIRSMRTHIKMYIIDEVHMLTKEAFNALLKTLEEPPPNVKFVFCTTEPQKVPDTILSRCQRFDFASIETQVIAQRLKEISEREGVEVTNEAIDLVARRAGGSMRDSQSLFDQLLAFGADKIEARDVNQLLGTAEDDRLLRILNFIHQKKQGPLLDEINEAVKDGVQLGNLIDQLVNCYRDLMVLCCGADSVDLIGVSSLQRETFSTLGKQIGLGTITAAMQILSEAKGRLARVSHGRALIDLAVIRVSQLENLESLSGLIADLKSSETGVITLAGGQAPQAVLSSEPRQVNDVPPISTSMATPWQPTKKKIDSPATITSDPPPAEAIPARQLIPFEENSKQDILSQLVTTMGDAISVHLKQVGRTAIIAPNRLDLFFNSNYAFSKSYFDGKPESVKQIAEQVQKLTGQKQIQVRIRLEQASEAKTDSTRETGSASPKPQMEKHEFVQAAETIFNATLGQTTRIRK